VKRPPLGWRTHAKLLREFHQGGIADRWSERRLLILLAEYRLNCRRELMEEILAEEDQHQEIRDSIREQSRA
jgi:hypothetical protein